MTINQRNEPSPRKPLRLWPGVVFVTLEWLLWTVFPIVAPAELDVLGMLGGTACGVVVILWWLFFSRAPWVERLGALALMIVAVPVAYRFADPSVTTAGMGNLLIGLSIPPMTLALVVWAVASQGLSSGRRRAAMVAAMLLACLSLGLVRIGGVSGDGVFNLHWRWTPTRGGSAPGSSRQRARDAAASGCGDACGQAGSDRTNRSYLGRACNCSDGCKGSRNEGIRGCKQPVRDACCRSPDAGC